MHANVLPIHIPHVQLLAPAPLKNTTALTNGWWVGRDLSGRLFESLNQFLHSFICLLIPNMTAVFPAGRPTDDGEPLTVMGTSREQSQNCNKSTTQTAQLMFDHFFAKANEWTDIAAG